MTKHVAVQPNRLVSLLVVSYWQQLMATMTAMEKNCSWALGELSPDTDGGICTTNRPDWDVSQISTVFNGRDGFLSSLYNLISSDSSIELEVLHSIPTAVRSKATTTTNKLKL